MEASSYSPRKGLQGALNRPIDRQEDNSRQSKVKESWNLLNHQEKQRALSTKSVKKSLKV